MEYSGSDCESIRSLGRLAYADWILRKPPFVFLSEMSALNILVLVNATRGASGALSDYVDYSKCVGMQAWCVCLSLLRILLIIACRIVCRSLTYRSTTSQRWSLRETPVPLPATAQSLRLFAFANTFCSIRSRVQAWLVGREQLAAAHG